MSMTQRAIEDEALARRALERLAAEEARLEEKEQEEAAQREQRLQAEQRRAQADDDLALVDQLAALLPLYQKRKQLAETAAAALAEFCQVEHELKAKVSALPGRPAGMHPGAVQRRAETLRIQAGLAPKHAIIGLGPPRSEAERTACVAMAGITRGLIGARAIDVGGKGMAIFTDEGV